MTETMFHELAKPILKGKPYLTKPEVISYINQAFGLIQEVTGLRLI